MSLRDPNPPALTAPAPSRAAGRTGTPALVLLGVNHHTAPLEVRERLAIPASRLAEATRALVHQPGVREAMILSTCNRVELLTSLDDQPAGDLTGAARNRLLGFLQEFFAVPPSTLGPHLYEFSEREAVRHLFRVASSLDSLVVGEAQILGQVKESWTVAREVGAVKSTLDPLLQRAFSVAKRVRTETAIGSTTVSVASVAAELARKIFGTLAGKTVLLVGAGKMSDLAARHLIAQGATTLLVSNRTESRAERIADTLRTPAITTGVIPFGQLHDQAHRADIVITSTGAGAYGADNHIFTPAQARALLARRRNRPVFFIDIAVPRDVSPEVNDIEGCFVYDIDDLQGVAQGNRAGRSREAEAAEQIVQTEVLRYAERLAQAPATEAIKHLLAEAELTRQAELTRSLQRLAATPLNPAQTAAIEALTRALTAKLLHPQITALRSSNPDDPA